LDDGKSRGSFSSSLGAGKKAEKIETTTANISIFLKRKAAKKIKLIVAPKKKLRAYIHIHSKYISTKRTFVMFCERNFALL
jgi:hypothetical protein